MNKFESITGVIVGRFQTPHLTNGHKFLIDSVYKLHKSIIIFVGVHKSQSTKRNPLDFINRKLMIQRSYPEAIILPINDHVNDDVWSENLDDAISTITDDAILYGSRESFLSYYSGRFTKELIHSDITDNATSVRTSVINNPVDSEDFRKGVIYGVSNRFPSPFLTVDIAMIKENKEVLLGKKDGEKHYRFVGGFVDSTDDSILSAAKRELLEEVGNIEVADFEIIGETKINDWRYKHDEENIFTVLCKCKYIFGHTKASDDIAHLEWIKIEDLEKIEFMTEHKKLQTILINNLKTK